MRNKILLAIWVTALALPLAACNEQVTVPVEQTFGPSPTLPPPEHSLIPTVDIATPVGWPAGGKPVAANGMAVNALATGLDHPRSLYVLPNGDVLVAETNAPPKPDDGKGIKGWIYRVGPAPASPAQTALRCCETPTATASPKPGAFFSKG
jgi:glucose/arabinose dehydrogenase